MKQISFLFSLLSLFSARSQSFSGSGGTIPDDGTTIEFDIPVSGLSPSAIDTNFGLTTVCIDLDHTWNADLEINLVAPDGTIVPVSIGNGGDSDGYDNTCFDMSASTSVISGWGPF